MVQIQLRHLLSDLPVKAPLNAGNFMPPVERMLFPDFPEHIKHLRGLVQPHALFPSTQLYNLLLSGPFDVKIQD